MKEAFEKYGPLRIDHFLRAAHHYGLPLPMFSKLKSRFGHKAEHGLTGQIALEDGNARGIVRRFK